MFYLHAGLNHEYGDEVALVGEYKTFNEAEKFKMIEEVHFTSKGLKFVILTKVMDPPPNISYRKLKEMVEK